MSKSAITAIIGLSIVLFGNTKEASAMGIPYFDTDGRTECVTYKLGSNQNANIRDGLCDVKSGFIISLNDKSKYNYSKRNFIGREVTAAENSQLNNGVQPDRLYEYSNITVYTHANFSDANFNKVELSLFYGNYSHRADVDLRSAKFTNSVLLGRTRQGKNVPHRIDARGIKVTGKSTLHGDFSGFNLQGATYESGVKFSGGMTEAIAISKGMQKVGGISAAQLKLEDAKAAAAEQARKDAAAEQARKDLAAKVEQERIDKENAAAEQARKDAAAEQARKDLAAKVEQERIDKENAAAKAAQNARYSVPSWFRWRRGGW